MGPVQAGQGLLLPVPNAASPVTANAQLNSIAIRNLAISVF